MLQMCGGGRAVPAFGALAALVCVAGAASGQATRHWVGQPSDDWDDVSNWSTVANGVPRGGLPQTGDLVLFLGLSGNVDFFGAGIADPTFERMVVNGISTEPFGSNQFRHVQGDLGADALVMGLNTFNNRYAHTGGNATFTTVELGNGDFAEGEVFIAGQTAVFTAGTITVGQGDTPDAEYEARGLVSVSEGELHVGLLEMAMMGDAGGVGTGDLFIAGGTATIDTLDVGVDGFAEVSQTGGELNVTDYNLGYVGVASIVSEGAVAGHEGGTLNISGTLTVGPAPMGEGEFEIDGAIVHATNIDVGEGDDGHPSINSFRSYLDVRSGDLHVTERLSIGSAPRARGYVNVDEDGRLMASECVIGDSAESVGELELFSGGYALIESLTTGGGSSGLLSIRGGELDAGLVSLSSVTGGGALLVDDWSAELGRLTCDRLVLNAEGLLAGASITTVSGPNTDDKVEISLGGMLRLVEGARLRADDIDNNGALVLGDSGTVTGTLSSGMPTEGNLVNDGLIEIEAGSTPRVLMGVSQRGELGVGAGSMTELDGHLFMGSASTHRVFIDETGAGIIGTQAGDIIMAGTLEIVFDEDMPLPPKGTEYTIFATETGTLTSTFTDVEIAGNGPGSEVVYRAQRVFIRVTQCGIADANGDGNLNNTDINLFVSAFLLNNSATDLNDDGFINNADINIFVSSFVAGCP